MDHAGACLERAECPGLLVGDLWVLAGQSNMEGCGKLASPALEPPHALVHCFDLADRWTLAVEPLHWRVQSTDPAHWYEEVGEASEGVIEVHHRDREAGVGPGLAFARELVEQTGVPVGLVPCAVGGTSMDQWDPALKTRGGESLYGALVRRHAAVGGRVAGVLWYQGESDAGGEAAEAFRDKMRLFVAALRSDLGQDALPFFCVQLGRFFEPLGDVAGWNKVRESQRLLPDDVPGTDVVTAVDLSLDDHIHLSTEGHARLGRRLASVALRQVYGRSALKTGPRPVSVTVLSPLLLQVQFAGVNDQLLPAHDIHGFSLRDPSGKSLRRIFRADVDPGRPDTVLLRLWPELTEDAFLWYGYGLHPVCNLTDCRDLAALAFGPWPICAG
jgi:sialate O-acetylesterase